MNVDTTEKLTMVEWCAGYGGIHLGLKRAIPNLRVIAYGEIEGFACANLVAKMEAGLMDAAPIWTDIKTFPCEEFRDRVDILVAGYPCQPFSAAGKRLGTEDPRHLWPYIADGIRILRPRLCFFENVEGHISLGLREVVGELESIGYKTAWGIFSASEVGAPHQRKRVFILAHRQCEGLEGLSWSRKNKTQGSDFKGRSTSEESVCYSVADSMCDGSGKSRTLQQWADGAKPISNGESWGAWPSRPGEPQHGWEPPRVTTGVANTQSLGRRGRDHGDAGGNSGEIQATGSCGARTEAMGDSSKLLCDGSNNISRIGQRSEEISESGDSSRTTELGNSESRQDLGREPRDLGAEAGQWRCGDDAADGASEGGSMGDSESKQGSSRDYRREPGSPCESEQGEFRGGNCWALRQRNGKAEPALGGNFDGTSRGLDYAELQISCDNRTDELRLLGNGVVPATAERAFRVLMEEINK